MKECLARAIEELRPRDASDQAELAEWLQRIAGEYVALRDHVREQPSPAELRDELWKMARAARVLAELVDGLSDAALELLQRPLARAGEGLDEARETFGATFPSPADQVRAIGLRRCDLTGRGLPMLLDALGGLGEGVASRHPVSRGSRREHVARLDPVRELVLACGDVIVSRDITVRAHLLTLLSAATHEQAEGVVDDAGRRRIERLSEEIAPKLRRWRKLMAGNAGAGRCNASNQEFFAELAELSRDLSYEIGRPPGHRTGGEEA